MTPLKALFYMGFQNPFHISFHTKTPEYGKRGHDGVTRHAPKRRSMDYEETFNFNEALVREPAIPSGISPAFFW